MDDTAKIKHLCLAGGGHSHAIVIKRLGIKPTPNLKVTLISPDRFTPYSGMLPGLIAGHYQFESCHIDLERLCQWSGIKFSSSTISRIDLDNRLIYSDQTAPIKYNLLSINIGSRPDVDEITGGKHYGCAIKPVKDFLRRWHLWLNTHVNSKQKHHIVVVGGGAAGIEVLLAMYYKIKKCTSINATFTLISADQTILSTHNHTIQLFFQKHLRSLDINVISNTTAIAIDKTHLYFNDGTSLAYDFTVWGIRAGAHEWPSASHLMCDKNGFILVDQYLRSISHPEIFAAGDCAAFAPHPLPKAGVYAVRQGSTLLKNILATYQNKKLVSFKPQQHFLSLLTTGSRNAVASRNGIFLHGKWVWYWKDYIDRCFMRQFEV